MSQKYLTQNGFNKKINYLGKVNVVCKYQSNLWEIKIPLKKNQVWALFTDNVFKIYGENQNLKDWVITKLELP